MARSEASRDLAPTRRIQLRAAMVDEIKAVARRQLVEQGPGAVSLRGIAREIGTASSALFRYFPSYNDLITALVVDALDSLATALDDAPDTQPLSAHAARWFSVGLAYRRWSLDHTAEFALTHGTPLPGYAAPADITGPPAGRALRVPLREYVGAVQAGVADPDCSEVPEDIGTGDLLVSLGLDPEETNEPRIVAIVMNARASMMGYLVAEIFGSLALLVNDAEKLYRAHLRSVMLGMGFDRAEVAVLAG
jgi:AcrR family transcriptional regulator